jgi:hypothetical protein
MTGITILTVTSFSGAKVTPGMSLLEIFKRYEVYSS